MTRYESKTLCLSHSPGFTRDDEKQHGHRFRAGLGEVRAAVAEFAPSLVVFFGSDHRRAFVDIVPQLSVVHSAEGLGDLRSPTGDYNVPKELAEHLTAELIARDFDVAITRHVALDHGFGLTAADVLGGIDTVPILPIFINCATLPLARPARAVQIGKAVGEIMAETDERVLYIGSGGLSHDPPTLALTGASLSEEERKALSAAHREAAKAAVNPAWDERFLANLAQTDTAWAERMLQSDIDPAGVGANEIRTWLAAYAAGGQPLEVVTYEPVTEWITGMGIAMSGYQG